jgi:hypothetical protein
MSAKLLVPGTKVEVTAGSSTIARKGDALIVVSAEIVCSSVGNRIRSVLRNSWGIDRTLWAAVEGDPDQARLGDSPSLPSGRVTVRRLVA